MSPCSPGCGFRARTPGAHAHHTQSYEWRRAVVCAQNNFDAEKTSPCGSPPQGRCAPMADASNNGGDAGRGLSSLFGLRVRARLCLLPSNQLGARYEATGLTSPRSPGFVSPRSVAPRARRRRRTWVTSCRSTTTRRHVHRQPGSQPLCSHLALCGTRTRCFPELELFADCCRHSLTPWPTAQDVGGEGQGSGGKGELRAGAPACHASPCRQPGRTTQVSTGRSPPLAARAGFRLVGLTPVCSVPA